MSPATKQRNDRAFARAAWVVLGCGPIVAHGSHLGPAVVSTGNSCALRSCLAVVDRAKAEADSVRLF